MYERLTPYINMEQNSRTNNRKMEERWRELSIRFFQEYVDTLHVYFFAVVIAASSCSIPSKKLKILLEAQNGKKATERHDDGGRERASVSGAEENGKFNMKFCHRRYLAMVGSVDGVEWSG